MAFGSNTIVPANAISCTQAVKNLQPRQSFLKGNGDINGSCCHVARDLVRAVSSQMNRKEICECIKHAAFSSSVDQQRAKKLPQLCKIDVPKGDCDMHVSIERVK